VLLVLVGIELSKKNGDKEIAIAFLCELKITDCMADPAQKVLSIYHNEWVTLETLI